MTMDPETILLLIKIIDEIALTIAKLAKSLGDDDTSRKMEDITSNTHLIFARIKARAEEELKS